MLQKRFYINQKFFKLQYELIVQQTHLRICNEINLFYLQTIFYFIFILLLSFQKYLMFNIVFYLIQLFFTYFRKINSFFIFFLNYIKIKLLKKMIKPLKNLIQFLKKLVRAKIRFI
ncbi:transmembrane protein, putative (macronuclear) [Tetrahymena thermophila SB210]|uniref:Transmembrane protein, putative n=1 Tax=Tetrahymena thermophila (strain SB210) TaxID=312017 RepID=W7X8Y8_TETTS|nr:transmembrane protein, putative [Tetrahymena thermophila SB210]EWS75855.1 transmembrane protein, putative [Tetrahymena thermophila SB210]|eukprot:XP_012651611.1 transmembrane protein, putative [Tetrahymena thermophila SB210]